MKCRGKILDYGIELINAPSSTLHEMPKVKVKFELSEKEEVDGGFRNDTIYWDGLFVNSKGELNKATAKNLIQMGFNGEDPIVLAEGPEGGAIDMDALYYIELEMNEKGYWGVKWINRQPGGIGEIKKASADSLRAKMASLKIKGDLRKMFEESNVTKKSEVPNMAPEFNKDEKLPF